MLEKQIKRKIRHKRIRAKVSGTKEVPRLCVFRSNKHIYAQLIDDTEGKTIIAASDLELLSSKKNKTREEVSLPKGLLPTRKVSLSFEVGKLIAKKAIEKGIERVVFDRGGYKYHGRVKALAEGAREGGLKF